MKKRNCRRTEDESRIHDLAVKLRKMTDGQLVEYIDRKTDDARREGFQEGAKTASANVQDRSAGKLLDYLLAHKVKGIGVVTISNLMKVAKENGFVQ